MSSIEPEYTEAELSHEYIVLANGDCFVQWCIDWQQVVETIDAIANFYQYDEEFTPEDIQIIFVQDFVNSNCINKLLENAMSKIQKEREKSLKEKEDEEKEMRYQQYLALKKEFEG